MNTDEFIVRMTRAITTTSWVASIGLDGMGDRVSRGVPQVHLQGLETILDVPRFLDRVNQVEALASGEPERAVFARFREGMQRREAEQVRRNPSRPQLDIPDSDDPDLGDEPMA
jgi:hypothetical protein